MLFEAVKAFFESLDLDVWDAWSFFKLLDSDGGGMVEIEEFFLGCLRFRGAARAMDVAKIIQDQRPRPLQRELQVSFSGQKSKNR